MSIRVDSTKKVPGHSSSWFCFVCFYYSSKHGLIALILEVEKAPGIIYGTVLSFFTGVFPLLLFTLSHLTIQRSKSSWVYSKPYTQRPKEGIFLSAYVVCIFDSFIIIKSTSSTSNNFSWEFVVFRDVDYKLSVNIYKFLLELSEELHPYSWDRKQRISNTTAV